MKKALMFVLCALLVLAFAACGEKEVANSTDNAMGNGGYSDSTYDENDEELMSIQDIIGFWTPYEIYQAPRASDSGYDSDEDVLLYAQSVPVQISANEFDSPLSYTDNAVYEKVTTDLDSLSAYGIQVDEVLEGLVGDGSIVRLDIYEGDSEAPYFQVFIINGSTMLYEGDDGYIFLASLEESVG